MTESKRLQKLRSTFSEYISTYEKLNKIYSELAEIEKDLDDGLVENDTVMIKLNKKLEKLTK